MTMLDSTRAISCPTCWAEAGDDCHTASGKVVRNGHVRRIAQAAGDPDRREDVVAVAEPAQPLQLLLENPCVICGCGESAVNGQCEPCAELGMQDALERVRQDAAEVRSGRLCWGCVEEEADDTASGLCAGCAAYGDGAAQDAADTLDSAAEWMKAGDYAQAAAYLDAAADLIGDDAKLRARLDAGRTLLAAHAH